MSRIERTPRTPFAKTFREIQTLRRQKDTIGLERCISEIANDNSGKLEDLLGACLRALKMKRISRQYSDEIVQMIGDIHAAKNNRDTRETLERTRQTIRRADGILQFLNSQGITGKEKIG